MSPAIGPSVGFGREAIVPFMVLGLCWLPAAAAALVWLAGHTASWVSGAGWSGPPFGVDFAIALARDGVGTSWPSVSPALVWGLSLALLVAAAVPVLFVVRALTLGRRTGADPVAALAGPRDVAALTPTGVATRARALRPSLRDVPARRLEPAHTGVALGDLRSAGGGGPLLRASWEDVVLAVMAPRAGKTTALAVPAILAAPGAVVATSNKADLWAATAELRAAATGERVWIFDPQRIAYAEQTWWWNPLRDLTSVEEAHRLASHFVQEVRGHRGRDFWTSAAQDLLTGLLLAAALSGRTSVEVYEWLNDPTMSTPAELLRAHGKHAAAASLQGRQHGAPETRDGVYETARTAAQCLRDEAILAWVTPPDSSRGGSVTEELDAAAIPLSAQSLYLLSKDGAGAAAPLVAALTDRVMREATLAAERRGGRLDPPLLAVLDEAANICRIGDLPDLYSHLGSRGVIPITILQSYRQGTRVWGELGMDALWSASTVKIIGPGLDDARLAEDISRLVGDHDIAVRSITRGTGQLTQSTSLRRQRILGPEAVRALPRGTALLLATGCRPAMITLLPWYDRPRAPDIAAAIDRAEYGLVDRATASARPGGGGR